MDANMLQALMTQMAEQNAATLQTTLERVMGAQSEISARNLNAMNNIVEGLREEILHAKGSRHMSGTERNMTTRRAFSLLPSYNGRPEEFETWRFQLGQFLNEDPVFPGF